MIYVNQVYQDLLRDIMRQGLPTSPRKVSSKEIISHQTVIDMNYPFVDIPARKIGQKFRFAEAAWILSGDNRVSTIAPYSKKIGDYSDDGIYFAGAYGPPVRDQLPYVLHCLRSDPESRQAVITIWRPRPYASKDIPCTVSLQFLVRHSCIYCIATMRSSDAWLGWVYDVFNFSCLSAFVALHLQKTTRNPEKYSLGYLFLTAGSQHLYATNHSDAKKIIRLKYPWTTNDQKELEWKGKEPDEFRSYLWNKADSR